MGPARRLFGLIQRLWEGVLAPAQDPRTTFASSDVLYAQLLSQIQTSLAEVAGMESRLAEWIVSASAKQIQLEAEAQSALQQGRDDLARSSISRSLVLGEEIEEMRAQQRELGTEDRKLRAAEARLADEIAGLQTRQQMEAARLTATETQARLTRALRSVAKELEALGIALEEMEDRVETVRARASRRDVRLGAGLDPPQGAGGPRSPDSGLEGRAISARVDRKLEAMRRKLD